MPKLRAILLFFACLLGLAAGARAAEEPVRFSIEGPGVAYDFSTGEVTYTNGVVASPGSCEAPPKLSFRP